ncbi:MAG: cytochrome c biogenesis protein CcsA, partial [Saprospiraceae bacterium]
KRQNNAADAGSWLRLGRFAFGVHGLSILGYTFCMFFVMTYKYYEYQYAQQHVSDELPFQYIFAAFWEGQEGSFTLWMFWHAVLGFAVMLRSKQWEAPVLSVLAAIQVLLASMIIGAYFNLGFTEFRLGSNPLLMLRDVMDAPIFNKADYVSLIKGNGLNPLLQNYWMTIHPPTLFLGFASTSIPFCFAIAALWRNEHKSWLKAVMPWALFSGAILGTGILMGGAWAYEALSFGGYWAWDPVENMSLVPWLILIAGIHTNLIARNTDNAIKSTYLFYLLSFILVVYSTFLTRSGVLGDSSVHAFTEMGLEWQLVGFMAIFTLLGFGLYFYRSRHIPTVEIEEATGSREFWMFIGALVLLFSSILITFTTSIPVYNKVSEALGKPLNLSPPVDVIAHYNKYQLWIGVFIGLLSAFAQYLRYKELNFSGYFKNIAVYLGISFVLSLLLTLLAAQWIDARAWQYILLLFCGIFSFIANATYLWAFMRSNLKAAGAAVAHLGFGLMIIGIMASGLNKLFISSNPFAQEGLIEGEEKEFYQKNILLMKDSPMFMSGYTVTYVRDTMWDFTRRFEINYKKRDPKTAEITEEFNLYPNVLYDKTFSKVAASNPSTKHYWNKDIFTHVSSLPKADLDPKFRKEQEDSLKYQMYTAKTGDTLFTKSCYAQIEAVTMNPQNRSYKREPNDIAIEVKVAVRKLNTDSVWYARPVLVLRENQVLSYPEAINPLHIKVRIPEIIFEQIFEDDQKLKYTDHELLPGEILELDGTKIKFLDFDKKGTHSAYQAEAGDVGVNAILELNKGNQTDIIKPLFVIRGDKPFALKDQSISLGLHAKLVSINPAKGSALLSIAQSSDKAQELPVEIAENIGRSDYIVLQAIVFPGINYFWIGSILMMIGLGMGWIRKLTIKN